MKGMMRRLLGPAVALALVMTAVPAGGAQDEDEPLELRSNLVEVFVTVMDGNRYVTGLGSENFEVFEDGIRQEVEFFDSEKAPASVALLLDTSSSMKDSLGFMQAAAVRFVDGLKKEDEVTVLGFGGQVRELAPLTKDRKQVAEVIGKTRAEGGTLLYDGMVRGLLKLEAGNGRRGLVLITDGADTVSRLSADAVAQTCGRMAVPVFVIGVGEAHRSDELKSTLRNIAERTSGKAYFLKDLDDLPKTFSEISARLAASYRLGFYRTGTLDGRWHTIRVDFKRGKGRAMARNGYFAL